MVVWQQCARQCTRDLPQTQNLVVFPVWLTQAVTLSRSAWWQVCGCMAMLETWLIPQLRDRGLLDDVWLQHAGAHFALSVRDVLNDRFPGRWTGRGSPTSPAPLPWPPRSPDLTTPDISLWGVIKGRVAARRYNNNEDFRRAVEDAFRTITRNMFRRMSQRTWRRIRLCVQHEGAHTNE